MRRRAGRGRAREGQETGLAQILENITGSSWRGTVLAAGAVISTFSVTLVVLRYRQPDLPRTFRLPGFPMTPIMAILGCPRTINNLEAVTLLIFLV